MAIIDPKKSLATNKSDSLELYFYRKAYKNNALMTQYNTPATIDPGVAEFWYDRQLYGKLDRKGNIVIIRDDFLKTLQTSGDKTFFALNFVALAFNEMRGYFNKQLQSNRITNKNTLFTSLNPISAWDSIIDKYHQYMQDIYDIFFDYLINFRREDKINNFVDFAEEFFIFTRNLITTQAAPITLSGFVTSHVVNPRCSGLIIDLFNARPSNDPAKMDLFINDINFNFFKHAVTHHGFVVDKNIPWRITANLSSEYMQRLMESLAFDVTYTPGPKHLFDTYYLQTYTLDMILLRKYMYDIYKSLIGSKPYHQQYKYCNNLQKMIRQRSRRAPLTTAVKEHMYGVKDFWLEQMYRFRLLELNHDLKQEDIRRNVKNAQTMYSLRGELAALKFLHNNTKMFFLNNYNNTTNVMKANAPRHAPPTNNEPNGVDFY